MSVKPTVLNDDFTDKYFHEDHPHSDLFNPQRATTKIYENSKSVNYSAIPTNTTRRMYGSSKSALDHHNSSVSYRVRDESEPRETSMTNTDVRVTKDLVTGLMS